MSGDSSGQRTNTLDTATRRSVERTGGALLWQRWKMTKPEACALVTIFPITSAFLWSGIRHGQTIKKKVNIDKISLINKNSQCFHLFFFSAYVTK